VEPDSWCDRRPAAGTPAAFEACYGTSWLAQLLEDHGFAPHLVHPSRCKAIASARLKNDKVDAAILAQLPNSAVRRDRLSRGDIRPVGSALTGLRAPGDVWRGL
jgi:hypothetical protein